MFLKIPLTISIALIVLSELFAATVNLNDIWPDIVWCGNNGNKALICHKAGGNNVQQLCVSVNALKQGHLTAESGVTRLHGEDYFGYCRETAPEETIIFPCNAAIKTPQLRENCTTIGDSISCGDMTLDNISAQAAISPKEITPQDISEEGNLISIISHPTEYQSVSVRPFSTKLIDDQLNFQLVSEQYGSAYSVDWCIHQYKNYDRYLDFSLTIPASDYTKRAGTVSRYEVWCGDTADNMQKIAQSETAPLAQITQYQGIAIPPRAYCIWRQKFFETRTGKRPWRQDQVLITGELKSF